MAFSHGLYTQNWNSINRVITFNSHVKTAVHVSRIVSLSGVNVIKVLHLYFTRVAIVSLAENNSCTCKLHYKCKTFIKLTPGVNVIKVLHLYFTRVAIVSLAENNSCTCKLQV